MAKHHNLESGTESKSWDKISSDLKDPVIPFQYKTVINHNNTPVTLLIDMDPGGGFEGGFEYTSMSAPINVQFTSMKAGLPEKDEFRFALHHETMMDKVGKFFGSEDIEIGFEEFDKQLVVKTNNAQRTKKIFHSVAVRRIFQALSDFTLQITQEDEHENIRSLELMIDRAILDSKELEKIYNAFTSILDECMNE